MWTATLALNGLIGSGVPQDWSTHMIGHEITALYGLDHAQTLAIVLPSMLKIMQKDKTEKLLQYSDRIWNIPKNLSDGERISLAIEKTQDFFEAMGIKTRFSDYGLGQEVIEKIIAGLKAHKMIKLGEREKVTPEIAGKVLELSL